MQLAWGKFIIRSVKVKMCTSEVENSYVEKNLVDCRHRWSYKKAISVASKWNQIIDLTIVYLEAKDVHQNLK